MKADGFASPWESAMKHGFVPLLCQNGVNCTGMSVKYRSTYLCRLEQVVVDDVSRRFQTESSARRETIVARLTRIFNGDRHSYPSLFLSNTKIYSSLRYFQIFISLTKNKVLLKKIIIINISISQIRFYVKMVSMKTWYIYVCFAKFLLLVDYIVDHRPLHVCIELSVFNQLCHDRVQMSVHGIRATMLLYSPNNFIQYVSVTIYDIIVDWLPETITRHCLLGLLIYWNSIFTMSSRYNTYIHADDFINLLFLEFMVVTADFPRHLNDA